MQTGDCDAYLFDCDAHHFDCNAGTGTRFNPSFLHREHIRGRRISAPTALMSCDGGPHSGQQSEEAIGVRSGGLSCCRGYNATMIETF
jgi:hypothetical protein